MISRILRRTGLDHRLGRLAESLKYALVKPSRQLEFHIVSCERNAGESAIKCLDSVYGQAWPREQVRHVFIDDASADGTREKIDQWLAVHPDHNVEFIPNAERAGMCANNVQGFGSGAPGSIVIELNGDDWLPDPGVLAHLNKIFADSAVWFTYNTPLTSDGIILENYKRPIPRAVIAANAYRDHPVWLSSHLHTFRRELFDYIRPETFIDPQTGKPWSSAPDFSYHIALIELAGPHARHVYRIMCVYDFHENSELNVRRSEVEDCARRIRAMPKYEPLDSL